MSLVQCAPASKETNTTRSPSAYTTGGVSAPGRVVATATWLIGWKPPALIGSTFVNVAPPSRLTANAVPPAA